MRDFKSLLALVFLLMFNLCKGEIRAYHRIYRSLSLDPDDEFRKCAGFHYFEVTPFSYFSPDDSERIRMIESSTWVRRNATHQPDPFMPQGMEPFTVNFCFAGGKNLHTIKNDDGTFYLTAGSVETLPYSVHIKWGPLSIRLSPKTGMYIVDVKIYHRNFYGGPYQCCMLSLVNDALTIMPENCFPYYTDCESHENAPFTFHAVSFSPLGPGSGGGGWSGLFTLCADVECADRVISLQINGETVQLLPVVMTARIPPP